MSKEKNIISEPVIIFHKRRLPECAEPTDYAALIHAYSLSVPLSRDLCAIGTHLTRPDAGKEAYALVGDHPLKWVVNRKTSTCHRVKKISQARMISAR